MFGGKSLKNQVRLKSGQLNTEWLPGTLQQIIEKDRGSTDDVTSNAFKSIICEHI